MKVTLPQWLRKRKFLRVSERLAATLEEFLTQIARTTQAGGIDRLVELDLTLTQARTMLILGIAREPWPLSRIADELGLSQASTGRNVDGLVDLDLVSRTENPDDRRVKLVALTDAGRAAMDAHYAPKRAAVRAFTERLPADLADDLEAAIRGALDCGACTHQASETNAGARE